MSSVSPAPCDSNPDELDELMRPVLENLYRHGESYPGAVEDCLRIGRLKPALYDAPNREVAPAKPED